MLITKEIVEIERCHCFFYFKIAFNYQKSFM